MCEDGESQCDEVSALQSIFTEEELEVNKEDNKYRGTFYAHLHLPPGFLVIYKNLMNHDDELESVQVDHLPPIRLDFDLPTNYPSSAPPNYKLSCPWLGVKHLVYLSLKLDQLWKENTGMPILFMWIDFLKSESLNSLGITKFLDLRGLFTRDIRSKIRKTRPDKKEKVGVLEHRKQAWEQRKMYNKERKHWKPRTSKYNKTFHDSKVQIEPMSALGSPETQSRVPPEEPALRLQPQPIVSFLDSVRDKFGIESSTPEFWKEINADVVKKQVDHVDNKFTGNIITLLVDFNRERAAIEFKKRFYNCDICFQSQLGSKCIEFKPCSHVYCAECIQSYFSVRVSENTVQSMPCPHDGCSSQATQLQIKEMLGDEQFSRYDRLLLNATLDMMSDVVYCPRKGCQLPVLIESDRMAYCHACTFAFCALCLRTYHGVQPCAMKNEEKRKLAMQYQEGSSADKALLEARYGKQQLTTLVNNVLSTDWITTHSQQCPSCKTSIEKSDGCNKMICTKCSTMFCWLCHAQLRKEEPYKHFYDTQSKCYNRLFFGMAPDSDEGDEFDFESGEEDEDFVVYVEEEDFDDYFLNDEQQDDFDY